MNRENAKRRIDEINEKLTRKYTGQIYSYTGGKPSLINDTTDNVYREYAIFSYIKDKSKREIYEDEIVYAADWFEHPHPYGREHRGEADFEAIRLVPLFFECPDALTDKMKASLERFFLVRDFSALYKSENHSLMYRAARYLASIYYKGRKFEQFGMTAEEIHEKDTAYFKEFYDFRARRGWGEFDSLGYGAEIMLITAILAKYTDDEIVRKRAYMTMDIILLDMICDGINGIYGGAHGRIYEGAALSGVGGLTNLYDYYFGSPYAKSVDIAPLMLLSDYVPSQIVYDIECMRRFPYENFEQKHLHSTESWVGAEIRHDYLDMLDGKAICKYTYVDEDYVLGAVNHQDQYPEESPDRWYAHHQQHEWDLTLCGGRDHKIFSHHPGDPGYHHIHNRWTGDHVCLCSTHYCNKNTAVSIYNIEKQNQFEYINACIPVKYFDKRIDDGKYMFLSYMGRLYISVYFDNGFAETDDADYKGIEFISPGRQNCVVVRVEKQSAHASFDAFIEHIKSLPVVYDRQKQTVEFDGAKVWYHGNSQNGVENVYPYGFTYNNPYVKSVWDSGYIECGIPGKKVIYDFIRDRIIAE